MPPKKKRASILPAKSPGQLLQYLEANFNPVPGDGLLNGHVLLLFIQNDRSFVDTIKSLFDKTSLCVPRSTLVTLVQQSINKYRNLSRDLPSLDVVCRLHFDLSFQEEPLPTPEPTSPPVSSLVLPPSTSSASFLASSTSTAASMSTNVPMSTFPPSSSRHSSRGDPLTPRKKKLRTRLDFVSDSRSSIKKKHHQKLHQLREKLSKSVSWSQHNQAIRRKVNTIAKLRKERQQHQCGNVEMEAELRKLRQRHRRLKTKKAAKISASSSSCSVETLTEQASKLKEKDNKIRALEDEKLALLDTVAELKADSKAMPSKEDNKTFSVSTRMLVYEAVIEQVPTLNVTPLLERWSRRLGVELSHIPKRHTVENMARELGVIASFQVAELAMETEHLTLGFDATTQGGVHINSIHFTTVDECFVVAIDELAGGTAEDYERHVCESIDELALLYSLFNELDYLSSRATIIQNISNTMTDRVNVNHAAIERIKLVWETELNELNCHLHPLDTIASSCRSALNGLETEHGALFGKDCMAGNIVLQMNKMRYKDGKGDPKGFLVFLDDKKLPRGILPRYRGNRLHVLFHICGKLVQHHSLFLEFLTTGVVSCGGLQTALRNDFVHDVAQLEMQVLGLFGKLLSGPWMKKFYTSAADQISHIDGIEVVRKVVSTLKECNLNPIGVLNRPTDFFGDSLEEDDECLKKLRECPPDPELQQQLQDMLSACLVAVISVLERQYKRYFEMELTDELREETQSARSHNIDAEEVMGMFSAAKQRAPNATLCYLSSRIRAKKNRTVDYLDNMNPEKRDRLVKWSVSKGRTRRDQKRRNQKALMADMSRRVADKRQKKTEKEMRVIEKRLRQCVNLDKLAEEFPNLEQSVISDLSDVLSGRAVGRKICHIWYDATTQSKTIYYGRIEKVKRKNSDKYVVAYWSDDGEDDPVDYDVSKFELGVDIIGKDLELC